MHPRTLLAAAVLAAASVPAAAAPAPVVGGVAATQGQFPTVVYVGLPNSEVCTGTLVAPAWVMTSASCLTPQILGVADQAAVTRGVTVYLDALTEPSGAGRTAVDTIPDPELASSNMTAGDVGLIHLSAEVADHTPVPINRVAADAPVGTHVELVGYGIATPGGSDDGTPRVVADVATEGCAASPVQASDTALLCWSQQDGAGAAKGDCAGDAGGPAFATIDGALVQVGVASFQTSSSGPGNTCDGIGAATRLDHVVAWIDQTVGGEVGCSTDGVCMAGCTADPDCPPDDGSGGDGAKTGGCSAGGGGAGAALLVIALGGLVVVRRRR